MSSVLVVMLAMVVTNSVKPLSRKQRWSEVDSTQTMNQKEAERAALMEQVAALDEEIQEEKMLEKKKTEDGEPGDGDGEGEVAEEERDDVGVDGDGDASSDVDDADNSEGLLEENSSTADRTNWEVNLPGGCRNGFEQTSGGGTMNPIFTPKKYKWNINYYKVWRWQQCSATYENAGARYKNILQCESRCARSEHCKGFYLKGANECRMCPGYRTSDWKGLRLESSFSESKGRKSYFKDFTKCR